MAMDQMEVEREPLSVLLGPERILVNAQAETWEDSVRLAGALLVQSGAVDPDYVDAMIAVVKELGPYVVIAPGVALPHARPEQGVHHNAFSLVRLRSPVRFGNPDNDPVTLVIALAARDNSSHIRALQTVATLVGESAFVERLRQAASVEEVTALVREAEAWASDDDATPRGAAGKGGRVE